jgi:DNA-binding NtrC family response regulator
VSTMPQYRKDKNIIESSLVGRSPVIQKLRTDVRNIAAYPFTVLITGESGTGKELVARAIHDMSSRSGLPFIPLNCGAFSDHLIESELFGHVRGSFTGAERDRVGLLEYAKGGTIFLDEITETSIAFQGKLLRVLEQREFRKVGSNEVRFTDVRIIAATNKDLYEEIAAGRFKLDLYHRLNLSRISIPPLRARKEDLEPLVEHFLLGGLFDESSVPVTIEADALAELKRFCEVYKWPGNVRELKNVLIAATTKSNSNCISLENLRNVISAINLPDDSNNLSLKTSQCRKLAVPLDEPIYGLPEGQDFNSLFMEMVERLTTSAINITGSKTGAARVLGINRSSFQLLLKQVKKYRDGQNTQNGQDTEDDFNNESEEMNTDCA